MLVIWPTKIVLRGHEWVSKNISRWRTRVHTVPWSHSPNLNRIAQFVHKLLSGTQNLEIRVRDAGHAQLGVVLYCLRREVPSIMSVPNLKRIPLFVRKSLGVPTFGNWSPDPGRAQLGLIFGLQALAIRPLCLYQIWSGYLIPSKVIRGSQNLEIGSLDRGHAQIGFVL